MTDENVKLRVGKWLQGQDHRVTPVPKGLPDRAVGELAKRQGTVLLTHDRDVTDAEKFPPSQYAGIVWLSLKAPTLERIVKALAYVLSRLSADAMRGKLVDVSDVDQFDVSPPT